MRTSRNVGCALHTKKWWAQPTLPLAVTIACCLVGLWFLSATGGIQGSQKTYEIKPSLTVPEYRTDAARAIDAYERLMERYMDLTEKNLFMVGTDIREVSKKLDSIDDKLTQLSAAIARIEKALGIELVPAPFPSSEGSKGASQDGGQFNLSVKKEPQP